MADGWSANTCLLLHMEGENNSTTFADSSSIPKTITRNGDAKISTTQSMWGSGSGYFDGNGDYLTGTSSAFDFLTSDFTLECWFKCENTNNATGNALVCVGSGGGYWQLLIRQDTVFVNYYNDGYINWTASKTLDTQWHHFAWTRSAGTHRIFYDGVSLSMTGTPPSFTPSVLNLYIGANFNGGTYGWIGFIQDLRITKGIARYTADFTPPNAKLPDPSPIALNLPSLFRCDLEDGGLLSVIEPVTRLNSPVSRRVRLCDQRSGRLVREGWSDPVSGNIEFANLREGPWTLYALDHTGEYEAVAISDRLATADGERP